MKISYNWLKDYIDHDLTPEKVADILTSTGLEVEDIEFYSNYKNLSDLLVIGFVENVDRHPDADKLTVCKVTIGPGTTLNIVCGAPNVEPGQKVVVAPVGTELNTFNGQKIVLKPAKIRGVVSEGMICAEDEIGTGNDHSGILVLDKDATLGMRYKEFLGLYEDYILEVAITPNRCDAVSHFGVARDLAAVLDKSIKLPPFSGFKEQEKTRDIKVEIANEELCPRYSGIVVSGITVSESPSWLQNRLKAIGLNPVNNIVDVTNFILFETGQPLHAFDLKCIEGDKIIVKTQPASTLFKILDGSEIKLNGSEIMICDAFKPVAVGGVMGGFNSMIIESTKEIFIESACFNPRMIRRTSKYHGIQSDASYRFERGSDPDITVYAMCRAAEMITEIAGGKVVSDIIDTYPGKKEDLELDLHFSYLNSVAGSAINKEEAVSILQRLGYGISEENSEYTKVRIPKYRADVTRPVDLVEEVLRIYSFERIRISDSYLSGLPAEKGLKRIRLFNKISEYLAGSGFCEIMTPSFINSEYSQINDLDEGRMSLKVLDARNSNLDTLKTGIMLSGLEVIGFNVKRNNHNLKFFEFGKNYFMSEKIYREEAMLGLWITGNISETSWYEKEKKADFYFLKAHLENILRIAGVTEELTFAERTDKRFTLSAEILHKKEKIAQIGLVNPDILRNFDLRKEVCFAQIDLEFLVKEKLKEVILYETPVKYPFILRDLSLVINEEINFTQIRDVIRENGSKILKEIRIVDVYEGEHIEAGRKSYLVRLKFQDSDHTLKDEHADKIVGQIIKLVENRFNAIIRK